MRDIDETLYFFMLGALALVRLLAGGLALSLGEIICDTLILVLMTMYRFMSPLFLPAIRHLIGVAVTLAVTSFLWALTKHHPSYRVAALLAFGLLSAAIGSARAMGAIRKLRQSPPPGDPSN